MAVLLADCEPVCLPHLPTWQMGEEKKPKRIALGDAVDQGIIANQTLAYFIGRTYLFAERVGGGGERRSGGRLGAASGYPGCV